MIIDSSLYNEDAETRAWLISKVNRISPDGIVRVTLTQDIFNQHTDYVERDENGIVVGKWADYYQSPVEPTFIPDDVPSSITSRITCSGKPLFKIGGSAKTFTVTFYNLENQEITDHDVGSWSWSIDGIGIPNTLVEYALDGNKLKLKFLGDDSYIGKILTITNTSEDITSSLDVEITAL